MNASNKDCGNDCNQLARERMRYFTGRHLSAGDFSDEQAYHRTHRLFHNRILHGWGVVCGFEVKQHGRSDCRDKFVQVSPGIAIDCCGREVVVECISSCGAQGLPEIPWDGYSEAHPLLLLCLCYDEKKTYSVAALDDQGDCSETKTNYARCEEGWKLSWFWIANSDLVKYQWNAPYGICPPDERVKEQESRDSENTAGQTQLTAERKQHEGPQNPMVHPAPPCPEDDCADPCSEGYKSCIAPRCPPGHCIPLAFICATKRDHPVLDAQIFMRGRPELPYGPTRLTHVVDINWPHGGVITPAWLKKEGGWLRVKFDRKLQRLEPREYPGPWGVNEATFVVQHGEQYEDLDFVIYDKPPALTENLYQAEYKISSRKHHRDEYSYLVGHIIWITLKCDFLYDCHDVRVDGNNDGIAGGTFESWVSVVSDEDYEKMKKDGKL